MTKNPFLNALAALLYISIVASMMFYAPKFEGRVDSVVVPIAMLSLFTLSAAMMGYCFVLQPLRLYLDGEKKTAVTLFVRTLTIFGGITAFFLLTVFFLIQIQGIK